MHGRHLSRWLRWLKLGFALALPLVAGTAALACRPRHPKAIAKALSRDSNGRSFGPLAHALDLLDQQQNQWGP